MEREIPQLVNEVKAYFQSEATLTEAWRRSQLLALRSLITENKEALNQALIDDLSVGVFWREGLELNVPIAEIDVALKHLSSWMKPTGVTSDVLTMPCKSEIRPDPLGVILLIAPWNYPVSLVLAPLVAAISAGNCVVVKPSELSVHTSALLAKLLPKYMDPRAIRVVEGAAPETTVLLKEKFDMIIYTGNGFVGRIVMRAAAEHLTPVLLELGGKSPAIVAADANIDTIVKRLIWGKFSMNVGQTCISPDYVLVAKEKESELLDKMKKTLKDFYTENPKTSDQYSRIINERHTKRIAAMLDDPSIEVVTGGEVDLAEKYIAPTILKCGPDAKCMQDEIFGPVLPVLTVSNVDEAVQFVKSRDKPLALYVFTSSEKTADHVLTSTSSGSAVVNDTIMQAANHNLPFGGVGGSGMGAYHGKHGFDACSHKKAVMKKYGVDPSLRFPPYTDSSVAMLGKLGMLNNVLGPILDNWSWPLVTVTMLLLADVYARSQGW